MTRVTFDNATRPDQFDREMAAWSRSGAAFWGPPVDAGAGPVAGEIGEALNPQQAKIAAMKADAEAMIRNSGVPPYWPADWPKPKP
jgi:hypothetical protein